MSPSVGKYYYTDDFLNINSTTFIVQGERDGETIPFEQVDYVNFGIMLCIKRSGGKKGVESVFSKYGSFSANSSELLKTVPSELRELIYREFLREFGRVHQAMGKPNVPWFVPREYGGFGLKPAFGYGPSDLNRAVCAEMKKTGKSFRKAEVPVWLLHMLTQKELDSVTPVDDSYGYESFYSTISKYCFLNRCSQGVFHDLHRDAKADAQQRRAVRAAERSYTKLVRTIGEDNYDWTFNPWKEGETLPTPLVFEAEWNDSPATDAVGSEEPLATF
jgi:hypothetical protein